MVFDELCEDLKDVVSFSDLRNDFADNGLDMDDYGYDNNYCNMEENFENWKRSIVPEAAKDAMENAGIDEKTNEIDGDTYEEIYGEAERYISDSYEGFVEDCIDEANRFNDSDIMNSDDDDEDEDEDSEDE